MNLWKASSLAQKCHCSIHYNSATSLGACQFFQGFAAAAAFRFSRSFFFFLAYHHASEAGALKTQASTRSSSYCGLNKYAYTWRKSRSKFAEEEAKAEEAFELDMWYPRSKKEKGRDFGHGDREREQKWLAVRRLSGIARYVYESFEKHKRWGQEIVEDLEKLHRVTPNVATEVLRVLDNAELASKFFHWVMRQKRFRNNYSVYNAYAFCLNRCNKYKEADKVLEVMRGHGKEPSLMQFEILIKMHAQARRGARVFFIYQKMSKFGVKPTLCVYNKIIDSLVNTGELSLAVRVFEGLKAELQPDAVTYMLLARGFCKQGRVDEAVELLEQMNEKVCKPDTFAYTCLIKTLINSGNLVGAWKLWHQMDTHGVNADVKTYTTLILALCKFNAHHKASVLFQEIKDRGFLIERSVYASLIAMYARNGRVVLAYTLFNDMTACGYRPDLEIYDSLIQGFCSAGHINKAYKLLQVVVAHKMIPHFSTIKPFLASLSEKSDFDGLQKFLNQISLQGRMVKQDMSKFFACMLSNDDKVSKAVEIFESLKGKGYYSVSIFNDLINGLRRIGDCSRAVSYFEEMKELNCHPNAITYNFIIPCFIDSGNIEQACNLFCRMKEKSWLPSVDVYIGLVSSLCKIGELNAALSLVRDCLGCVTDGPQVFKQSLTVYHASKSGKSEDVLRVLTEIMEDGISLHDIIYCTVIAGLCNYGNSEEVRKVFSVLRKRNLMTGSSAAAYDTLMIEHLKNTASEVLFHGLKFYGLESLLTRKNVTAT